MGRWIDLIASTSLLTIAAAIVLCNLSIGLSTGDWLNWQTYAVWIGLTAIGVTLLVWSWMGPNQ